MLRLNVDALKGRIAACDGFRIVGKLRSARGVLTARMPGRVGDVCLIRLADEVTLPAEVIGFEGDTVQIMPFRPCEGAEPGCRVIDLRRPYRVPVGERLLGRVINGLGHPLDDRGALNCNDWRHIHNVTPSALQRPRVAEPFVTGQRVIDGLLTCGRGQRVGLFAGSGVGKSTLLGEIARHAVSDVNIIVLVGERGREVRPFLEDCLGEEGLRRSVVVVATADETPLMRVRAVSTGIAIADHFRRAGRQVLFLLDSLTRMATAQREIGLARGEPPTSRGYTPSVFSLIASTLESLGNSETGSITGILTVLVDGDDFDEPITDSARSVLDGHVVLSRKLAEKGQFPAVDVGASISRVFRDVTTIAHQTAARKVRSILATYEEVADLIQIGAYQKGSVPRIDRAVELLPKVHDFLKQPAGTTSPWTETQQRLSKVAEAWPW
ncbi:MAG: FliI/YscN family ATPase [Planctomycetaceae bacterium]